MRGLYRLLLRLYPRAVREEFGPEMLAVFEEASAAERPAGRLTYALFCAREAWGLLANVNLAHGAMEVPMGRGKWIWLAGLAGFVLALGLALQAAWAPYTSTATLSLSPPKVPSRYALALDVDLERSVMRLSDFVMSRGALTNSIHSFDLYPGERSRLPMEDVIEQLRRDLTIRQRSAGVIEVQFRYRDRILAQKFAQQAASHMIDAHVALRSSTVLQTVQFLVDRRAEVGQQWEKAVGDLAHAGAGSLERLRMEVDIARKNYEELSVRLAEAETAKMIEERRQGPLLELLDPASLPVDGRPSTAGAFVYALLGGLAGAGLGWCAARLLPARGEVQPAPSLS